MRLLFASFVFSGLAASVAFATCKDLPSHAQLKAALTDARRADNGGLNLDMWAVLVDRTGVACAVAYTGAELGDQWPGSRLIAAAKANTANAFSLPKSALSTANLYSGAQPGGFLFGIATGNALDPAVGNKGDASAWGTEKDPLVGARAGGTIVFGGGLALYDKKGALLGGLGVSGDTSCADHNIAWRTRHGLDLDFVPGGVARDKSDQIIYDIRIGRSSSGFGHPTCVKNEKKIAESLPGVRAVKN